MFNVAFTLLVLTAFKASQQESSLYQCLPNSNVPGQSWIPNIPSQYFTNRSSLISGNLETARYAFTYVFEVPALESGRNCTGNVSAIQVCYRPPSDQNTGTRELMTFLVLDRQGTSAAVTKSFPVMVNPQTAACSSILISCCEVVPLQIGNQFELSSGGFTYGMIITQQNIQPILFASSVTEYNVNQYQIAVGLAPPLSVDLQPTGLVSGSSLMVLRFTLGKLKLTIL